MSGTCLRGWKKELDEREREKGRFETRADYTFIMRRVQIKCTREWLGMGSTPYKRNIFADHMCLEAGRTFRELSWPPASLSIHNHEARFKFVPATEDIALGEGEI